MPPAERSSRITRARITAARTSAATINCTDTGLVTPVDVFSVNVNLGTTTTDETDLNQTATQLLGGPPVPDSLNQRYLLHTRNSNNGFRLSYSEPIAQDKTARLYYLYNNATSTNDKRTYLVQDTVEQFSPQLSNAYTSHFITHQGGVNFRENKKKYNFTVGFGLQPTSLTGNSTDKDTLPPTSQGRLNFLPQATFNYNFARTKIFTFRYFTSINQPSITQPKATCWRIIATRCLSPMGIPT